MTRGQKADVGSTRWSPNNYHYTKTPSGWRFTHHLIMEQTLGRPLQPDERVIFKDGKSRNLDPANIVVQEKGRSSIRRRKAQLEARIAELQAQLDAIIEELAKV